MTTPVRLRPLAVSDAPELTRVLADPDLYTYTGGVPPLEDELVHRFTLLTRGGPADGSERWINDVVLTPTGEAVGYVQATVPAADGPTEIAWVIGVPWQGRGFATAAARLLLERLAGEGVAEVVADIHPDHAASNAVARALGLHPTDEIVDGETRWAGRTG